MGSLRRKLNQTSNRKKLSRAVNRLQRLKGSAEEAFSKTLEATPPIPVETAAGDVWMLEPVATFAPRRLVLDLLDAFERFRSEGNERCAKACANAMAQGFKLALIEEGELSFVEPDESAA